MVVDRCFSDIVLLKSDAAQGGVLGPLFFIVFTSDMWNGISSKMITYVITTKHSSICQCLA